MALQDFINTPLFTFELVFMAILSLIVKLCSDALHQSLIDRKR